MWADRSRSHPVRVLPEARTIAKMLDAADLERGDVVLELGCGLGYCTALLAHLVDAVVAVEVDADLASEAEPRWPITGSTMPPSSPVPLSMATQRTAPMTRSSSSAGSRPFPRPRRSAQDRRPVVAIFMNGPHGEVRVGLKSDGRLTWRMDFNASAEVLPGFEHAETFSF
jgi:protein-L-isoaspartate(D-aspartate) O-methyltransferase